MKELWNSLKMFLWMSLLTGIFYPLLITGISQLALNHKANGSFINFHDKIIGSELIAQETKSDKYFWPRPSAVDYNPLPSGGSNFGATSSSLKKSVEERKSQYGASAHIPSELLFSSGSGLDPHITVTAAQFQSERISKARNLQIEEIRKLIDNYTESRTLGIFGIPKVNVLKLNIALDEFQPTRK